MVAKLTVQDVVEYLGIRVTNAGAEMQGFCPLHDNTNTPAFSINSTSGAWICFSGKCGRKGSLRTLWAELRPDEDFPLGDLKRLEVDDESWIEELYSDINKEELQREKLNAGLEDTLAKLRSDDIALSYMLERNYSAQTLNQFEVKYSMAKNRIVIPVRDESYKLVGLIGRAVDNQIPKYLYTKYPKKMFLFNLCRAKTAKCVILVEGSLDAMKVHQAGFPNVCAVLGSSLSHPQALLIKRYFSEVIVFADNDAGGWGLANSISDQCDNVSFVDWDLMLERKLITPNQTDPGDLYPIEIAEMIKRRRGFMDVLMSQ